MGLFFRHLFKTVLCCLLAVPAFAQHAVISGPVQVQPGDIDTYTVTSWPEPLNNAANVNWTVTGGTIVAQDRTSCQVQWITQGLGTVLVEDDLAGMNGELDLQIGAPIVRIYPGSLAVDYGSTPPNLIADIIAQDAPTAFTWEQSGDLSTWTLISGATTGIYVPSTTFSQYYRFTATIDGVPYTSDPVYISLNPLNPGSISLSSQPAYNSTATITNTAAHGGTCLPANDSYTWEASVDGQPWVTIGTGVNYPSGFVITGKTSIRRKTTCNGVTAISNVLYVVPAYTSVDYENLNYVRTIDVHVAGINTWYQADQLSTDSKSESTTYLDGLGRPVQKVAKSASLSGGSWVDLVQPVVYDPAGRTTQQFLPYPTSDNPGKFKSANVMTEQASFVTGKFGEPSGAPTYARTDYDNSPLNRVINSYAPGQSWGGSSVGVTNNYDFNTVDENVHVWNLAYSLSAIPSTSPSTNYATGSLYKLTSTDEKGKQVITYTDLSGNVILKKVQQLESGAGLTNQHAGWACTYYVYDDLGQQRFVITPKAVDYLDNNSWNLTQQLVNDLCFVYGYDGKGRNISKKQPGAGETDMVYDQRNRPVMMQDANGRANNQWQVTLYDGLDRVTSTGMLPVSMASSSLQSYVDANTGNITVTRVTTTTGFTDLSESGSQNGASIYVASNSITFYPNFTSDAGGTFVAYIDPNLANIVNEGVPIADNPVPNSGSLVTLTQTFYDDYSHATRTYTTADNSLFDPSTNAQAQTLPAQASPQTRGMATSYKVKVITNPADLTQGNWLQTDSYYDDQGRVIQVLDDNSLAGTDIVTNRYDFIGKLWGSCVKHMAGSPTQFTVVSKNTYDIKGRLTDVSKNFNSTFFKDLASYAYDEYGKMITKRLAPGYTGSGKSEMESLTYDYNIQGWLTGINKNYALSTNTYDQWNQFFGLYLGYTDNQFTTAQFNGSIAGAIWKSQGDNSMRKYDYTYDNLGRLTSALFNQRKAPADGWSNSAVDLSEYVTYADGNGNINTMKHMGVVPGTMGGVVVDDLLYTYGTSGNAYSNQLSRVDERATFTGNGTLNDFKDGANASGSNDYTYDAAGNLVQDLNKGITDGASGGVVYNYLNKPVKITIAGKSIIQYTYDATGVKLSKTVTNLAVTPNATTTTAYDEEFVYQDNVLLYVLHEEGRMKIIAPAATAQVQLNAGSAGATNVLSGKQGVFEYFIKDQLSNTRMVLTEEVQKEVYIATAELTSTADANLATDEEKLFGQVDATTHAPTADNELSLTRTDRPTTLWTGNTSDKVVKLTASLSANKVGPNMMLKVSAGDMIHAASNYFYYTNDASGSSNGVTDALTSLVGAILSSTAPAATKINSSLISSNLGASGSDFSNFIGGLPGIGNTSAPKSYLNIVFFDEQFNFIAPDPNAPLVGSAAARVSSANDQAASLVLGQKAPKNGWVYIYLSNESNQDVYFDNLCISQEHGRISEENHYYAFGQKIAGICTSAFNKLPNKYNYQGDYSEEEENTGWNEFDLRMYDPQIGRWIGADPYDEFASPYVGMGNDPVNNVDEDGGFVGIEGAIGGALLGGGLAYLAADNNSDNKGKVTFGKIAAGIGGALVGAGIGYSIEMSVNADINAEFGGSPNLWQNFKAFYAGLFDLNGGWDVLIDPRGENAFVPQIWRHTGDVVLPPAIAKEVFPNFEPATVGKIARIVGDVVVNIKAPPPSPKVNIRFPPRAARNGGIVNLNFDGRQEDPEIHAWINDMEKVDKEFFETLIRQVTQRKIKVLKLTIQLNIMEDENVYKNYQFTQLGKGTEQEHMRIRAKNWADFIRKKLGYPVRIVNDVKFKQFPYGIRVTGTGERQN